MKVLSPLDGEKEIAIGNLAPRTIHRGWTDDYPGYLLFRTHPHHNLLGKNFRFSIKCLCKEWLGLFDEPFFAKNSRHQLGGIKDKTFQFSRRSKRVYQFFCSLKIHAVVINAFPIQVGAGSQMKHKLAIQQLVQIFFRFLKITGNRIKIGVLNGHLYSGQINSRHLSTQSQQFVAQLCADKSSCTGDDDFFALICFQIGWKHVCSLDFHNYVNRGNPAFNYRP